MDSPLKLSILIPTLPERYKQFVRLYDQLHQQIAMNGLQQDVEVLFDPRPFGTTIGSKRQALVDRAAGQYVVFIDDDDVISGQYLSSVYRGVLSGVDVIGFIGHYYHNGVYVKPFKHSISCGADATGNPYWEDANIFYRCPNHLNPMKREHAMKARFKAMNFSEDTDFAMQLYALQCLKSEYMIEEPIYQYFYQSEKSYIV